MQTPYFVYILRCEDRSLYTGIATDWQRRLAEHRTGRRPGARYTAAHPARQIEQVWQTENRSLASRLEYRIKSLTRAQKEQLIAAPDEQLAKLLGSSENAAQYHLLSPEQRVPNPDVVGNGDIPS